MANIQGTIDEMFKKKEEQNKANQAVIDSVMGRKQFEHDALIAKNKEEIQHAEIIQDLFKDEKFTEEEQSYYESPYFKNYIELIKMLDTSIQNACNIMHQKYDENNFYYKNAFYKPINNSMVIRNIGFPVPEKFLNKLGYLIEKKTNETLQIDDCECDVSIVAVEYAKKDNMVKRINGYQITTTVKEKIKENMKK